MSLKAHEHKTPDATTLLVKVLRQEGGSLWLREDFLNSKDEHAHSICIEEQPGGVRIFLSPDKAKE
jgi:hypothetical protein